MIPQVVSNYTQLRKQNILWWGDILKIFKVTLIEDFIFGKQKFCMKNLKFWICVTDIGFE